MKSDRWLYRSNGQEFGPVPFDAIVQLARSGLLTTRDDVCREGSPWEPAGEIVGLFEDPQPVERADTVTAAGVVSAPDFADVLQSAPGAELLPATEFDEVLRFAPTVEQITHAARTTTTDDPSATEFYCRIAGVEVGPLAMAALQSWIEQGRLSAEDQLRAAGSELWLPAGEIDGLRFNQPGPRAAAAGELRCAGDPQDLESLAADVLSQPELDASASRVPRSRDLEKSTAEARSSPAALDHFPARRAAALQPLMAAALSNERPSSTRSPRRGPELGLPDSPLLYALAAVIVLAVALKLWPESGGALRGRVLVDGKPVPVGSISFVSGTAPSANGSFAAVILDGAYEISDRTSLPADTYNVVVTIGSPLGEPPPEIADDSLFGPLNRGRFLQTNVSPDPDSRVLDFSFSAADAQWPARGEGPQGQDIHQLQ